MKRIKLSKEQVLDIINLYKNGTTISKLIEEYGYKKNNHKSIINLLRKNNITIRQDQKTHSTKYNINNKYFEVIDTEDKAYFLGLLYADGSNSSYKTEVKISLIEEDKHILETFNLFLNSNKPLRFSEYNKKNINWKNQYSLTIENKKIASDLNNLGLIPKKSLILKFPTEQQVPEHLIKHFIRGYFDGDGCITVGYQKERKSLEGTISFLGTNEFLDELIKIFKEELNITIKTKRRRHKDSNTNNFSIAFGGNNQVRNFSKWLYKDATIYLFRKYEKFKLL